MTLPSCSCRTEEEDPAAARTPEEEARRREEERQKQLKKKKPDFEIGRIALAPGDRETNVWVKPGHWASATQAMKTNHFDFAGEVEVAVLDRQREPVRLERTPFRMTSVRPAILPKAQEKQLDLTLFVPHAAGNSNLASTLRGADGGREVQSSDELFSPMPAYQYFFVVLSDLADRYTFLKVLDSVRLPTDGEFGAANEMHYRVVAPPAKKPVAVPTQVFTWTSTAYVLWDGMDPDLLSLDQQTALVDWLHWGGQLIISGPRSFDKLRGSFLAPYLPAEEATTHSYTTDDLAVFNAYWAPPRKESRRELFLSTPWSGVAFTPQADAKLTPQAAGLLLERRVGRGRVVLSAMHLNERALLRWRGFDNFFNACVLRRPARQYRRGQHGGRELTWDDPTRDRRDSRLTAQLRLFSRDAGVEVAIAQQTVDEYGNPVETPLTDQAAGGVASWNAVSPVSNAAREVLRQAAGITIPKASFVIWTLALYLIVLVPLNWLFFTAIGRVEWAWIAAPIISVVFALLVIRFAQLDIGFARAQTEIAVLEVQGAYPRAHLTRYTALYTSLSTTYDLRFDNLAAVAQPLPLTNEFRMLPGQGTSTVTYRRWEDVSLDGVTVASNSTGLVHSEQMLSLAGPLKLGRGAAGGELVHNGSQFDMEHVAVLRRVAGAGEPKLEGAWVGALRAQSSADLRFTSLKEKSPFAVERNLGVATDADAPLNLGELIALAQNADDFEPGEVRLVGRIAQIVGGAELSPAASQVRSATLVVAHLSRTLPPPPLPDVNARDDVPVVEPANLEGILGEELLQTP